MNTYVTLVPIAILILAGTGVVSQAFAVTITIETDNDVYDHSSIITVTGTVSPVDQNEVPVIITCISPKGGIACVAQISVNNDGSFSTTFPTSTFLMKDDGTYQIKANYGNTNTSTSVELTGTLIDAKTVITGQATTGGAGIVEGYDGHIEYSVTCDTIPSFFINENENSLVIHIDPTYDGTLTITLHEELIKPFDDGDYYVLVDNESVEFEQGENILTIPCLAGTEKIEIYGSWIIPEFGVIAAMILAVAIVSIIVITAKTRLSLVQKY